MEMGASRTGLATGGDLSGRRAEPRGKVSPTRECLALASNRQQLITPLTERVDRFTRNILVGPKTLQGVLHSAA